MKHLMMTITMAAAPIVGMGQGQSGIETVNLDKTVRPADNFYQFATGGWQKRNPLPAAYSRFGSFDQLQEDNNKRINAILSDLLKKTYRRGTMEQKLSDFYKLALDSARRNREGLQPVKALLDEMEAAPTKAQLQALQLKYADNGYGIGFSSYFGADEKNVTMNILSIGQGGLTLGQKDYYLNNDEATRDIRQAYRQHLVRMFRRSRLRCRRIAHNPSSKKAIHTNIPLYMRFSILFSSYPLISL